GGDRQRRLVDYPGGVVNKRVGVVVAAVAVIYAAAGRERLAGTKVSSVVGFRKVGRVAAGEAAGGDGRCGRRGVVAVVGFGVRCGCHRDGSLGDVECSGGGGS